MQIDKAIPISDAKTGRKAKYPFNKMMVGDSVFFKGEVLNSRSKPYSAARSHADDTGKKFSGRTVDGGLRIWRVL